MKLLPFRFHLICVLAMSGLVSHAVPLGTAFTYQGRLQDGAQLVTGIYDLRFSIYDALSGGGNVGGSLTNTATPVTNGLFTVSLDFGATIFEGSARWLAIEVRTNGGGIFVPLNPRQPLSPTPNAIYATKAGTAASATTATTANTANAVAAGSVGTAGLTAGAVDSSRLADGSVGVADLSPAVLSNTFWRLGGNRSTVPGTDFVGTTDNQPLELKVNGLRALRLEPTAANEPNVVGGLSANSVASGVGGATIAGGGQTGGWQNTIAAGANYGAIGGGRANAVNAQEGTVAGGAQNRATGEKAFVGGGFNNQAGAFASTVGGGWNNQVSAQYSTLGGGIGNAINNGTATIAGGAYNTNASSGGTIAGGNGNNLAGGASSATIGGGAGNFAQGSSATISGGASNLVQARASYSSVGGGLGNWVNSDSTYSVIAGGAANIIQSNTSGATISGGADNTIEIGAHSSTISGGWFNTIRSNAIQSTIGGGWGITIHSNASSATVAGGLWNTVGDAANFSSVGGGQENHIGPGASFATIPGGKWNQANAPLSMAAGQRAQAGHKGTFVWADSTDADFASTRSNQFLIRATGGVGIGTNNPQAALHVVGNVNASNFVGSGTGLTTLNGAALSDGSITAAKFAPGAVNHLDAPDGSPASAVLVNSNGLVGIGTATPQAGLDIQTSGTVLTPKVLFEVQNGMGAYTNLSWASSVSVAGNLCAIGANGYGDPCSVTLVDISNPQSPVWRSQIVDDLGVFTNTYKVGSVAITSNLLAIPADYDGAVTLVNIADPANPVKIAELRDGVAGWNNLKGASAVAISGNLLAIAARDDQAVTLADISNPAAPVQRAVISTGTNGITFKPWARPIALYGNLLAIAGSNAVSLLDVSNPASPVQRAKLVQGSGAFTNLAVPVSVALSSNLMAVSEAGDVVTVVEVTNPSAPVWKALLRDGVDGATLFRGAHGVALSGTQLAVAANLGVMLFDFSQPAQPRMLAAIRQNQGGAHLLNMAVDAAFAGTNLAVASISSESFTLLGFVNEGIGLLSDGWVGVGTSHPLAPLHVVGDVVIEGADRFNAVATHVELGMGSSSYGLYSVALGHVAEAIGNNSIAIGTDAKAGGVFATALGRYSQALGSEATALGGGYASGYRSVSLGNNVATGWSAVALGESSTASGSNATAIGYATRASGDFSTALGSWSVASGRYSTALGLGTTSSGDNAIALGDYTTSSGKSSLAAGHGAAATNDGTFVWADSINSLFTSTASNQFLVRASGGVGINTNKPQATLHVAGNVKADSFTGSGAGLTALPAGQLTGTLPPASIGDSTVTSAKIQDGTLTASDIAPNTFWKIGGNSGTSPDTAFLGTTDLQPFEIRVYGERALRIETGLGYDNGPNLIGGISLNGVGPDSYSCVIGGGYNNTTESNCYSSVIAGGAGQLIESDVNYAFIGGGANNRIRAESRYAMIPGGCMNYANSLSFAAGYRAYAQHQGSFVWADPAGGTFSTTTSNQFLIRASGGVGIGAAPEDALLDVEGNMHLNDFDLFLRGGADRNHGLGWYGAGKTFSGYNLDGPVLYGCAGGGLGTMCSTQQLALRWDNTGRLMVDPANANTGSLTPGLTFGLSSGEGIGSKRTAGGNQYGLDFYTSFQNRMTILNSGLIGVGTTNPTHLLHLHSASTNTMRLTSTGANGAGAKINFGDAEYVYLQEVSDDILRIQATRTGIGRTPIANRLEVEGDASKTTASGWAANSDARIKTDIATVTNALDTLARVRPVSFRYTDEYRAAHPSIEDRPYFNVVAQEFREVFPEAVKSSGEKLNDGSEVLQVDTYPLTIYSAAAIRELKQKLEAREAELQELKQRLLDLEERINGTK